MAACQSPRHPTYFAQPAIPVGEHPVSLVATDLDEDGDVDLAVPGLLSNDLQILDNDGLGHFSARPRITLPGGPLSIVAIHAAADRTLDLLISLPSAQQVIVLRRANDLLFRPALAIPIARPGVLAAADITGDGVAEVLVARFDDGTVSVLRTTGDWVVDHTLAGPQGLAALAVSPGALFLANTRDDQVWRESLAGQTAQVVPVGPWPSWLALGDLDGRGGPELVGAHNLADTLFWYSTDEANPTVHTVTVGAGPFAVELGDLDQDGDLDAVATNKFENSVSVLDNDGAGNLGESERLLTGDGPTPLALADFDGDGRLDFAVVDGFSNDVVLYLSR